MQDDFASHTSSLTSPAGDAVAITPDDAAPLARTTRALYVGQGGDLVVEMVSGAVVTLAAAAAGAIYPIRIKRVLATGTTAGALVGLA